MVGQIAAKVPNQLLVCAGCAFIDFAARVSAACRATSVEAGDAGLGRTSALSEPSRPLGRRRAALDTSGACGAGACSLVVAPDGASPYVMGDAVGANGQQPKQW